MQTTFTTTAGKTFAPPYFAVYHAKNGKTFRKAQSEINAADFSEYDEITKIELYENGTENLSAVQIEVLYNE